MMSSSEDLLVNSADADRSDCRANSLFSATRGKARLGEDLLGHLPVERQPGAGLAAPSMAARDVTAFRVVACTSAAGLYEFANSLGAGSELVLVSVFAILLERLAAQGVVHLRDCSGSTSMRIIPFEEGTSFRSVVSASTRQDHPNDQPCAVEFMFGKQSSSVELLPNTLRLRAHVGEMGCELHLASSTGLWSQSLLELWLRYFDHLLASAIANPEEPWKTLSLLEPAETIAFYRELNDTRKSAEPMCLHQLVGLQVERCPHASAIVSSSAQLTYLEVDQRSDAIAARLRVAGAGPNRSIVVFLERSAELPVALLAVLKAGACYVPLDTQDAPRRIATILSQCQPVAIITDGSSALPPEFGAIPIVNPKQIPESPAVGFEPVTVTPHDQAYVIYTSGTTGKPKGVPIVHSALVNLIQSMRISPGFTPADRMLAVAPISFDIATLDMFLPLASGGTLVVADRNAASDPARLAAMLEHFEITVLQATPVTWRLLVTSEWEGKHDLKMISGGETLPRDLASQLLGKGKELWNQYGPTETTIYSSVLRIDSTDGIVPLGPPIANTQFYVLDEEGTLLPPGVPGELYIGGAGLSPGYLEPPQGIERFLPDPFAGSPGARMFRTGDLVRLLKNDEFEFFGRLDHQVKLRGYRIELGEIEFALRSYEGVDNAVATLAQDVVEPHLIAYVTADRSPLDLKRLRSHVSQLLPPYMVPARFVLMERFPLTGSGKIDRKALLASASSALSAFHQPEGVLPTTDLEASLLAIFRDVLRVPEFGVTDSFFDFGGYSLLTVKLFARIHRVLKVRLPISVLFDAPTVRSLAVAIYRSAALPSLVEIRSRGTSPPLFVVHSYLLYDVLRQIVEPNRPVYGLRESVEAQPAVAEDCAAAYVKEILRVCPEGPVFLTGWCAAGSLTLEIARQIQEQNRRVGLVALLDAERPGYSPRRRGKWLALLSSRLRSHWQRIRGSSLRQKVQYAGNYLLHVADTLLESLFVRHRPWVLRLQRVLGPILPDSVFDNSWARIGALQTYSSVPYKGKVVLFRATNDSGLDGDDETLGWNSIVPEGVEVIYVPGDHETMFLQPNVHSLSQSFRLALQAGEA